MDRVSRELASNIRFGAIDQITPGLAFLDVVFGGRKTRLVFLVLLGAVTAWKIFTNPVKQQVLPPDNKPLLSPSFRSKSRGQADCCVTPSTHFSAFKFV